ncbi:MAG: hypothetical protein V3R20_02985 [Sphingomonadales bacterium]
MARFSLIAVLMVAFGLLAVVAGAEEPSNLESLVGIPVMAGLVEDLDQRIIFDKPEGRIIHVVLKGDVSLDEAFRFYQEVLYQLGWELPQDRATRSLIFNRDQEYLTVFAVQVEPLELIFDLKPSS